MADEKMIINKSSLESLSNEIKTALGDTKKRNVIEMANSIPDVKKKGNIEGRCEVADALGLTNRNYNNLAYKLDKESAEYICAGFSTNSNEKKNVNIQNYIQYEIFPVTKLADMAFFSKSNINTVTLPGSLN